MENLNISAFDLSRFQSDFLFFQKEINNIRKNYINTFVAILDKNIVGSASSIEKLMEQLEKKHIDISKVVVEFVSEEEDFMVL